MADVPSKYTGDVELTFTPLTAGAAYIRVLIFLLAH